MTLKNLKFILKMNWLSNNHILIHCCQKKLIFPEEERMQFISIQQFERDVLLGAKCFMLLVCATDVDKTQKYIFVIWGFMDVLLEEILGLPPKRR